MENVTTPTTKKTLDFKNYLKGKYTRSFILKFFDNLLKILMSLGNSIPQLDNMHKALVVIRKRNGYSNQNSDSEQSRLQVS